MKQTQHQRILALLLSRPNQWIPLTEMLDLRIAQYGRAVNDLRNGKHAGKTRYNIENKTVQAVGVRHSWFRIVVPVEYKEQMTLDLKKPQTTFF